MHPPNTTFPGKLAQARGNADRGNVRQEIRDAIFGSPGLVAFLETDFHAFALSVAAFQAEVSSSPLASKKCGSIQPRVALRLSTQQRDFLAFPACGLAKGSEHSPVAPTSHSSRADTHPHSIQATKDVHANSAKNR